MSEIKYKKENVKIDRSTTAEELDNKTNPDCYKMYREAIRKAGSVAKLAEILGVKIKTVNKWLFPITPSYINIAKIREFIRNGEP
jgi:transposase-like protein